MWGDKKFIAYTKPTSSCNFTLILQQRWNTFMYLKHTLLTHDSTWYPSYEVILDIQPKILPFNQLHDIVAIVPKFSVIYMTYIFDISKSW